MIIKKLGTLIILICFSLVLSLGIAGSAFAATQSVTNKFLALTYEEDSKVEIGYSNVDEGHGYFVYFYKGTYDQAFVIIANDLALTGEVTQEEIAQIKNGNISEEKIASWFSLKTSDFTKETINGNEYRVFELYKDGENWVYYIFYHGTVEYQFCMPAKVNAEPELLKELLKKVTFTCASSMVPIKGEKVDIYFDNLGAGIKVPDYSVYYYKGMNQNHPNWIRSLETYDDLMDWMEETNTYVYILSDDIYDEIQFYYKDSFEGKNLNKTSDYELTSLRDRLKKSFESQGYKVKFIDDGIYKGTSTTFIALQIADASGNDSKYYYTSDGVKGYVLECYYYENQKDEEFLNTFKNIVDTFYLKNNGISTTTVTTTPTEITAVFSDIDGHWASTSIIQVYEEAMVSGVGNGIFNPDAKITKAEFIQMIYNFLQLEAGTSTKFIDVKENDWFFKAVGATGAKGILDGLITQNDCFNPNSSITREEMSVILANVVEYTGIVGVKNVNIKEQFSDYSQITSEYQAKVQTTVNAGLMNGMSEKIFAGKETSTRAQAAQVMINVVNAG